MLCLPLNYILIKIEIKKNFQYGHSAVSGYIASQVPPPPRIENQKGAEPAAAGSMELGESWVGRHQRAPVEIELHPCAPWAVHPCSIIPFVSLNIKILHVFQLERVLM